LYAVLIVESDVGFVILEEKATFFNLLMGFRECPFDLEKKKAIFFIRVVLPSILKFGTV